MPIMDGFQLSRIIDYEMGLPVVLISADGEVNTVLEGIKHNACDYLLKPTRMEELKLIWKHVAMKSHQKTKCFNPRRKGKENGLTYEVDASCQDSSEEVTSTRKMAKLYWEPQLHNKFVVAFNKLGRDKATAKRVYDFMNVPGITRKHVASHLQTYKKKLKKDDEILNSIGFGANCMDSSSLPFNGQTPNLDNSMFLPSTTNQQNNFRENNSTRSDIMIFSKPQLASNLSLVPREHKPTSHVNNNLSSSACQPWFSPFTRS